MTVKPKKVRKRACFFPRYFYYSKLGAVKKLSAVSISKMLFHPHFILTKIIQITDLHLSY